MQFEPQNSNLSLLINQRTFFDCIEVTVPQVRTHFITHILPAYLRLSADSPLERSIHEFIQTNCSQIECVDRSRRSEFVSFLSEVGAWQSRWNLTDGWMLSILLKTLIDASKLEEPAITHLGWARIALPYWEPEGFDKAVIRFEVSAWDPLSLESIAEHKNNAVSHLQTLVENQSQQNLERLINAGWVEGSDPAMQEHYRWLVQFQVLDKSYEEIARTDFGQEPLGSNDLNLLDAMVETRKKAILRLSRSLQLTRRKIQRRRKKDD